MGMKALTFFNSLYALMPSDDSTMTIAALKEQVKLFCEARDWDQYHNAKDLAIGVSTEAGELLDLFRFKSLDEVEAMFRDAGEREAIEDEASDVLLFLLRLAQRYEIDMSSAFKKKMKKNERKYPVESSRGSNKKYNKI
jgi:NTP pyrophosphatase (non-canonical NTP hydrolase)